VSLLSAHPDRLGGRYDVRSLLGTGGMADVYLAHDLELDRDVAVKVLRDAGGTSRFRAEARTLSRLRHPALVGVLDLGEVDGRPYLVLELVQGTSLAERCAQGPLPREEVARVGEQVAAALAYVHEQGVVHRDVSPGNVLLSDDGRVHLADFGIARLVEDHPTLTAAGETLGTAPYLAPEQVRGEEATPAVDVYALGLVLLEALTGRRAFDGIPTEAALARLQRDPDVPQDLPADWRELLLAMTQREPADRPAAAAVETRLDRLAGAVPATRALTVPVRLPSPPAGAGVAASPAPRVAPRPLPPALGDLRERVAELTARAGQVPLAVWFVVAALVAVVLVALLPGGGDAGPAPLPRGVPSGVAPQLQHLHDAVEGR
jgi:serine/threonine protein kinase